jgi:hypothetical protein
MESPTGSHVVENGAMEAACVGVGVAVADAVRVGVAVADAVRVGVVEGTPDMTLIV